VSTDLVYLDHNATTPVAPEVLDAMLPYLRENFGNPSSDHPPGRAAARAVAAARAQVAALIGADPAEIVFTSGGTESNNLAIRGTASVADPTRRRIVTTVVEHPATTAPLAHLETKGWTITALPVTSTGTVDAAAATATLGPDVALVTMMLAQNETGAILPVPSIAAAARAVAAVVHTDAAQAIGKIEVAVDALAVDLLSIAGHKCYAPKGVGALYRRAGTPLGPVLLGAGQERGVRPGTENVASIVGLGAACELAGGRLAADGARLAVLRDTLWEQLRDAIPAMVRHTPQDCRPTTPSWSPSPTSSAGTCWPHHRDWPPPPARRAMQVGTPPPRRCSRWDRHGKWRSARSGFAWATGRAPQTSTAQSAYSEQATVTAPRARNRCSEDRLRLRSLPSRRIIPQRRSGLHQPELRTSANTHP
jgi:cysteine desulfurase